MRSGSGSSTRAHWSECPETAPFGSMAAVRMWLDCTWDKNELKLYTRVGRDRAPRAAHGDESPHPRWRTPARVGDAALRVSKVAASRRGADATCWDRSDL